MDAGALLLGRVTYEGFAAAWPSREGPFAEKLNSAPKHVVSTTLESPGWSNSTVIRDDVPAAVRALKEREGGDVLVNGSGTLVRTLLEHDLVDELRLMVFPVVLGAGRRLFPDGPAELPFRLAEARQTGEVAILRMRRDT